MTKQPSSPKSAIKAMSKVVQKRKAKEAEKERMSVVKDQIAKQDKNMRFEYKKEAGKTKITPKIGNDAYTRDLKPAESKGKKTVTNETKPYKKLTYKELEASVNSYKGWNSQQRVEIAKLKDDIIADNLRIGVQKQQISDRDKAVRTAEKMIAEQDDYYDKLWNEFRTIEKKLNGDKYSVGFIQKNLDLRDELASQKSLTMISSATACMFGIVIAVGGVAWNVFYL